jgi:hypothetical protein
LRDGWQRFDDCFFGTGVYLFGGAGPFFGFFADSVSCAISKRSARS